MQDKPPVVFVVGMKCEPELDEKLNSWYNNTHIPMLLKSKHLSGVTRYKLAPTAKKESPPYLTVYEFKDKQACEAWFSSPELAAAGEERKETWREKSFEVVLSALYEPLKTWHK